MWGGRFSARPADIMQAINVSIGVDRRLWAQDLAGSRAHCHMLAARGIVTQADADAILGGLDAIEIEIRDGTFPFRDQFEDIHMNVEARLAELQSLGIEAAMVAEIGDAMMKNKNSGIRKLREMVGDVEEIIGFDRRYEGDSVIFTIAMRYAKT